MSSFNDALKYLQRSVARKSTIDDLKSSASLIDPLKYSKRTKTRKLDRIPYYFTTTVTPTVQCFKNAIGWQWNYSFPFSFRLIKLVDIYLPLCVRWRNGDVISRYKLYPSFTDANNIAFPTQIGLLNAPFYTNQLIPKNFVIEFWSPDNFFSQFEVPFKFYINKLAIPSQVDDIEYVVPNSNPIFVSPELYTALPENIPTDYNVLAQWLDNV